MEIRIRAYLDGSIIYSGFANANKLDVEQLGNFKHLHIWLKDRFIGVISCDSYDIE